MGSISVRVEYPSGRVSVVPDIRERSSVRELDGHGPGTDSAREDVAEMTAAIGGVVVSGIVPMEPSARPW